MANTVRPDPGSTPQALALAEQHFRAGRRAEAEVVCRQILNDDARCAPALNLLGLIAHGAGDLPAAIGWTREAAAADDRVAPYFANLCEFNRQAGRLPEALDAGRRAIALDPASAAAFNNLGIVHFDLGDPTEAAAHYRRALALKPAYAQAQSNLGNALGAAHRFDEAISAYRRALEIDPGFADAWSNLGSALNILGRRDEALEAYRAAVVCDPLHGNAHTGLALQLLLRGRFDEGWLEYEWRRRSTRTGSHFAPARSWSDDEIVGRRILVRAEQGLGDTLQFCRYANALRERGASVVLTAPRPLVRLLGASLDCAVIAEDDLPPAFDVECAMMSLPLLLGTREATIPWRFPYLSPPRQEMAAWREHFSRSRSISVGIAWAGNPRHVDDHNRSIAPSQLRPLLEVEGVQWVSLQVEQPALDPGALVAFNVLDASQRIADFADTAAVVAALDLVICVDSAVAHLAGALSQPAWVLLPVGSDWRWLIGRETSPWYPTLRLFRQAEYGRWTPVLEQVAGELRSLIRKRT